MQRFAHKRRSRHGRIAQWLAAAIGLVMAGVAAVAAAAAPSIDTIVVMLLSFPDSSGAMSAVDINALAGSLRSQFSIVGHTRDGAYVLQLQPPLPLDDARAALNRARLLPQVTYANVVSLQTAADGAFARAAAAKHPPVARLIVKYRDPDITRGAMGNAPLGAPNLARLGTLAGQPVSQQRAMSGGEYVVRLFQALPVDQAAALARSIAQDPGVEYAVPDLLMQPLLVPNDPLYSSQWHYMSPPLEKGGVNLPPAWDLTTGNASIVVAVIDTGSLAAHPDLAGRYVGGYDFISTPQIANDGDGRDSNPADPGDWITAAENASGFFAGCGTSNSSFHGTHVAGTIGAASNNATGVAGINWVSKILPVRVLGKCGGYTSDIVDAIRWAAGLAVPGVPANPNPARVMNMSFGGYACDINGLNCGCDAASQSAIDDAVATGAILVVAAGNSNRPAVESSPANCNGVVTVGATGRLGERAFYSNYGPLVEISAPGGAGSASVLSTVNTGTTSPNPNGYGYGGKQGTSMATPHVAGIASLMLSANPSLTPSQATSILQTSARAFPVGTGSDCTTAQCGAGIVDAAAAVLAARNLSRTTTSTLLVGAPNPAVAGASVTLTASVSGNAPSGSVSFTENGNPIGCAAATLAVGNPSSGSCSLSSLAVGTHSIVASYSGDPANLASTSPALSQAITAPAPPTATVSFVGSDTATQGNWKGNYGSDGYAVFGDTTAYPAYAAATPSGKFDYTWAAQSTDARALQRAASGRIAACWYSASSFELDLNLTDGASHRVALYLLDWDNNNRATRVEVLDAATQQVLATQSVQSYQAGVYLVWKVQGHVRLRFTNVGGANAVLSGIFFDPTTAAPPMATSTLLVGAPNPAVAGASVTLTASVSGNAPSGSVSFTENGNPIGCAAATLAVGNPSSGSCSLSSLAVGTHSIVASYSGDPANLASTSPALSQAITAPAPPTATVSFVGSDTATQGNWKGNYGSDGYAVFGDTTAYPAYAAATPSGKFDYTWAAQSTDARALQRAASGRIAACWYSASSFELDLNLTDGASHRVALYLLDWDNNNRATRVEVLDAATQQVLATQSVQSYQAGVYLVWKVQGHVRLRFTNVGGANAVLSGIFFDPTTAAPPMATSTLLVGAPNPAVAGASVTLTASVSGNAPSGSVSFTENGNPIGCAAATLAVGNPSSGSCSLSSLAVGTHSIVASYSGDPANLASTSPALSQAITAPTASCAPEIVIDNLPPGAAGSSGVGEVSFTGNWAQSGASGGYGDNGSLYSFDDVSVPDAYTWRTPVLSSTQSCTYAVYVWWTTHPNRSVSVPITVSGQTSAPSTQTYNQQLNGSQWVLHGSYTFAPGARASVQVTNAGGQAAADAVRFVVTAP